MSVRRPGLTYSQSRAVILGVLIVLTAVLAVVWYWSLWTAS